MKPIASSLAGLAALAALAIAGAVAAEGCSASASGSGTGATTAGGQGQGGNGGSGGKAAASTGSQGGGGSPIDFTTTGTAPPCGQDPNVDSDHDGFTPAQGDCNDCDPNANPGAVEVIDQSPDAGPPVDEDCNGTADDVPQPCDSGLALDSLDPYDAAKAVGLCQKATENDRVWGVLDAKWVMADGSAPPTIPGQLADYHLGHGILPDFGSNVHTQEGGAMLALSSGMARRPTDPGYQASYDKGFTGGSPAGFPKPSPACPGVTTKGPHDPVALEVTIRTPTNANGFAFDFNFYTAEWPKYICTDFNDFFVTMLSPIPAGMADGNISFDKQGNPVSVNNAFVDVCSCTGGPPCMAGGKSFACSQGSTQLQGTGFEGGAATGWLVTTAPVTGATEVTVRFAVYDSSDGFVDATTLVDHFRWLATGGTVPVGTDPIQTPK